MVSKQRTIYIPTKSAISIRALCTFCTQVRLFCKHSLHLQIGTNSPQRTPKASINILINTGLLYQKKVGMQVFYCFPDDMEISFFNFIKKNNLKKIFFKVHSQTY